jgi:hypothetical protein
VSNAFRAAQKQFDAERTCMRAAREKKYADGGDGRRGAAWPSIRRRRSPASAWRTSTSTSVTRRRTTRSKKAFNDSASLVAREILAVDPLSRRALTIQYDALRAANNPEATDVLLRLAAADPQNAQLLERVINELAASGQAARAVPFANKLVADNPGDPNALPAAVQGAVRGEESSRAASAPVRSSCAPTRRTPRRTCTRA